jgi:glycosyltransferase involved in cell wall biosynthesis
MGGGDWWYHNRGHYDMQMMSHLALEIPILYVNSIGVRVPAPSEGTMFARRIARKLRSFSRGLTRIGDRFWTLSPVAIPGRLGMRFSRPALVQQVRFAARRIGVKHPLVWVTCPPAEEVLEDLRPAGLVYQRTDRWECFPHADEDRMRAYHERLAERADLVLFCSDVLYAEEANDCRAAAFVDHGVDFERFERAGRHPEDPEAFARIRRPRVGFVGGIDSHTFDPQLFLEVAQRLPDLQFVLVGACSLPRDWCRLGNVHQLGRQPYDVIERYMAACDVLIMPWARNRWIEACNPVKLKEYLAVGRPVVSTPFPQLRRFAGLVRQASRADQFAEAIREALANPGEPEGRRSPVRDETWLAKSRTVLGHLSERGLEFSPAPSDPSRR